MWPFFGTGGTRTQDALSLWRETNGLLRELVEALRGGAAETPRAVPAVRTVPSTAPPPTRQKLSANDVTFSTREAEHARQQEAAAKIAHPHRVGEIVPPTATAFQPPTAETLPMLQANEGLFPTPPVMLRAPASPAAPPSADAASSPGPPPPPAPAT